ncbi:MAG: hypothetical protein GY822_01725 [Deltaproteobacteria bacterium]|nr:hypothetical protein [Deltaproteobacteria bacterium]
MFPSASLSFQRGRGGLLLRVPEAEAADGAEEREPCTADGSDDKEELTFFT